MSTVVINNNEALAGDSVTIENASDLGSGTALDNQVLTADGLGNSAWETSSGTGATTLDALNDVDTTGVTNGQALVYDANTVTWVSGNVATQTLDIDLTAIADLTTTGLIERTGNGTANTVTITTAGKNLLDDANTTVQRTTLELNNVVNLTQKSRHGFPNRTETSLSANNTSHVVTVGVANTAQIFIHGVPYTINSPGLSLDIDDKTLSVGLWYIWIEISGGVPILNASKSAWSITNLAAIPAVMAYWNGSSFALMDERHSDGRNLELHTYLHLTVGARIQNDESFAQIRPTTTNDGHIELTAGVLWDEDIDNQVTTAQGKLVRNWYETAANVWTFADGVDNGGYDRPYIWNGTTSLIQYPKSDSAYTLTDVASNRYMVVWVYASNDINRPIYIVTPSYTTTFSTAANARAAVAPVLPFAPELKLLYRWIYRGDGQYQEGADYRTASSLPSGGVTAPTAASVTFAPTANVIATNVQSAIEELSVQSTDLADFTSGAAGSGQVPTADGAGGVAWATPDSSLASGITLTNIYETIHYQEATDNITVDFSTGDVQYIYVNPAGASIQITMPANPGEISKAGVLFVKNAASRSHSWAASPVVRFTDQVDAALPPVQAADECYIRYACQWVYSSPGSGVWWVTVAGRDTL